MHLQELTLTRFRNYDHYKTSFGAGLQVITGSNGSGKTNLLDAIYLLCIGKTYFGAGEQHAVQHGQSFFRVEGTFVRAEGSDLVCCTWEQGGQKEFSLNRVFYQRLADHLGRFPVVVMAPDDIALVNEGSEERRRLMDATLSQLYPEYLQHLMAYMRVLAMRNASLKQSAESGFFDHHLMDALDAQLVQYGIPVFERRRTVFGEWIGPIRDYYARLSGEQEDITVEYESALHLGSFPELLKQQREKDRAAARTTGGLHRDDWTLLMNGRPVKRFGSQGQRKCFLLAIKLAQHRLLARHKGFAPILLLDDVFDKLDPKRVEQLLDIVSGPDFSQVFITDTQRERMQQAMAGAGKEVEYLEIGPR